VTNRIDFSALPFGWLLVFIIITVAFGTLGYLIAAGRVKQPFLSFMMRFALVFFLLFFLELVIVNTMPSSQAALRNLAATLVGGFLTLAGAHHSVTGSTVTLQNPYLAFEITEACLGGMLLWTYGALVLTESSATRKQRVHGLLIGVIIILLFNLLRIFLSVYLEWKTAVRVHDYFFLFNMVFVLLVWLGWVRTLKLKHQMLAKSSSTS
jgi:exosortase/archaeosortase family protein